MADRSSAQDTVCLAVDLGWLLAELYDSRKLPGPPRNSDSRPLPAQLPGIGKMTAYEKACALVAQADADLARLGVALDTQLPSAENIRIVLDKAGHTRDDVRAAVYDLYLDVRNRLAGSDPGAALALGLGRLLADTALRPASGEPGLLAERFGRYRVATALGWLDDLDARLPGSFGLGRPRIAAALGEVGRRLVRYRRPDRSGAGRPGRHPRPSPAGIGVAAAAHRPAGR